MTDHMMMPGTHPQDYSVPEEFAETEHNTPLMPDQGHTRYRTGRRPFGWVNEGALGTFQRLAGEWTSRMIVVDANQGGTAKAVGRTPGRTSLTLWVPTTVIIGGAMVATPAGVLVAPTEGELQLGTVGVPLGVGDSMRIPSEGSVWVGLLPGALITQGFVCVLHAYDAPGAFSAVYD